MSIFIKKILIIISISFAFSEDTYFQSTSSLFTIDTNTPTINVLNPSDGSQYYYGQSVQVTWLATDDLPLGNQSISIFIQPDMGSYVYPIPNLSNIPNTGEEELFFPDIDAPFAQVVIRVTDYFGNTSIGQSPGYFIIGNPNMNYDVDDVNSEFSTISSIFEIDTKEPEVEVLHPVESMNFLPGSHLVVQWTAEDDNLINNSIDILLVTDLNSEGYLLNLNIPNTGQKIVQLPPTSTSYAQILIRASDEYGFNGVDLSDGYFSIGLDEDYVYQDSTANFEALSEIFTIDSKMPSFNLISETDYFYPNGGEILTDYTGVNLNWNCHDDSFENGTVTVKLAYLLGGWYTELGTFPHDVFYTQPVDFSFNGVIDNTIWARLIFEARDDFGNTTSQYNDDYFVLGSSDGNIGTELYDTTNAEMYLSWTWDNKKHRVAIKNRALEFLNPGDQISIVDESGIIDSDCSSSNGPVVLSSNIIESAPSSNWSNRISPIETKLGVDHCLISASGGKLPGYVEGDTIRFKITTTDENSYYIRPSVYNGSITFNNQNTVIGGFNQNSTYQLDSERETILTSIDERDIDNFNVYSKSTIALRDINCDNDGVCDSAELVDEYINQTDCETNNYTWDLSSLLCYYDYNNDGAYSPDEADENISQCADDCCANLTDDSWCFVEMVSGEEYTHSLISDNYIPNDATLNNGMDVTIKYKVYALNSEGEEVYQAVSEDASITLGSNEITSMPLTSGWNWISFNRELADLSINSVFEQFTEPEWQCDYGGDNTDCPNYAKIANAFGTYYSGFGFYPDFIVEQTEMVKVKMNAESELWIGGPLLNVSETPINLSTGWNWIGYLPNSQLSVNTALSNIINNDTPLYIKGLSDFGTFYSQIPGFYPTINLTPNSGYMLKMGSEDILYYNEPESSGTFNNERNISADQPWEFNYRDYEFNATATLQINMPYLEESENDYIGVFHRNECKGIAYADLCPITNEYVYSLMFYSHEEENYDYTIQYYNSNTNQLYDIRETLNFVEDENYGNVFEPILMHDVLMPLEFKLNAPYPNPFNPTTTINFELPKNVSNLTLNVFDIRGRLIETLHSGAMDMGYHSYLWNANNIASGIYFVHLTTSEHQFIEKITLLK
tara:strand:- start:3 stop:3380 length:3378 start_codon:yes stop_codon:yes gene_type:complete